MKAINEINKLLRKYKKSLTHACEQMDLNKDNQRIWNMWASEGVVLIGVIEDLKKLKAVL